VRGLGAAARARAAAELDGVVRPQRGAGPAAGLDVVACENSLSDDIAAQ
jgi:hypothetical protein